jgi:hypothetical protein
MPKTMNISQLLRLAPVAMVAAIVATAPTAPVLAAIDTTAIEESLSRSIVTPESAAQRQFGELVEGFSDIGNGNARKSLPVRPPISLSARDYAYGGDSTLVETQPGQPGINEIYFKSCLSNTYSVLGTRSPYSVSLPTVNQPIVGVIASNISPNLNAVQIARLKEVKVKFRYAFQGNSQGARMRLAVRNVNTNKVLQFGDFRVNGGTCQTFSKDIVGAFKTPGVYRLEVRLVNKPFLLDPSDKSSPFLSAIAVAGLDSTTIDVSVK